MFDDTLGIIHDDDLPVKHLVGRTVVAGLAALAATKIIEKAYDTLVILKKFK